jgi:hypothetical protein
MVGLNDFGAAFSELEVVNYARIISMACGNKGG